MKARSALLLAAVVLAPALAALQGASPLQVGLNLGPGDGPYVSGFFPEYEIERGTALHWSRPEAALSLPLTLTGPAEISLRFGPPPGGPSRVDVSLDGRPLPGFDCCRHRALQRRRLEVEDGPPRSLRIAWKVTGAEVTDRGLFLDRVDVELRPGARVRLAGLARIRPAALIALAVLVLVLCGCKPARAALLVAPLSAIVAGALLRDPWLVHRLLTHLPETLLLAFVPLAALGRGITGGSEALRAAGALATLTFLLRGAALHHPDFYYPDLMVHARLVAVAREAGPRAWLEPKAVLYTPRGAPGPTDTLVRATSGLWLRRLGGVDVGLPYSLGLHTLLSLRLRSLDATVSLLETAGALLSAVPIAVLAFLAPRFGVSAWWAAAFLVAAPTGFVELSLGTVPAAFGHALDMLFVLWLARKASQADRPTVIAQGTLLLALIALAYVSSSVVLPTLVAALAALRWPTAPRAARGLLFMVCAGGALSVALYYRAFVPDALSALGLALRGQRLTAGLGASAVADQGGGRVDAAFLLWVFPLVAVPAAIALARFGRPPRSALVLAWGAAFCLLGLTRLALPGVLGFLHVALFATPLLALCLAAAVQGLSAHGRHGRAMAVLLAVLVLGLGFALQGRALLAQLGNAR